MRPVTFAIIPILLIGFVACGEWDDDYRTPPDTGSDPGTDMPIDTGFEPTVDPTWDPGFDPGTDPGWDPGVDPGTDPYTDPYADPGTEPCISGTASIGGTCNVFDQCGCSTGETCVLELVPSTCTLPETCISGSFGTAGPPEPCADDFDCRPGSSCLGNWGFMFCYDWCRNNLDCSESGATCTVPVEIGASCGTATAPYNACSLCPSNDSCNPAEETGCGSGDACYLYYSPSTGCEVTTCYPEGTGAPGGDCTTAGCISGYGCFMLTGETIPTCRKYCLSHTDCESGESCVLFGFSAMPLLGLCVS